MPTYLWQVFVPGEDLPRELRTDYLLTEGDLVDVGGRWLVQSVEVDDDLQVDDDAETMRGLVHVAPAAEPAL